MKLCMTALVLLLVASMATVSEAAKDKPLKGQISAIDGMKITVSSGKKSSPTTTDVTCDEKTTVTRDGKDAKVTDLKTGDYVTITPATGTATSIVATTTKPEKKPKA